jgi:hypothetical protein
MLRNKSLTFILNLIFFVSCLIAYDINGKNMFGFRLKFISLKNYFPKDIKKKTTEIIHKIHVKSNLDSVLKVIYPVKSEEEISRHVDSLIELSLKNIPEKEFTRSFYLINEPINGVYPLDNFFNELSKIDSTTEPIRVGHYGDSQIEGDRMTFNLRKFFQTKYSGEGVGYLPMTDITNPVMDWEEAFIAILL